MGLCITIRYGEEFKIGNITLCLEKYRGSQVRIKIDAPKDVPITRKDFKPKEKPAKDPAPK